MIGETLYIFKAFELTTNTRLSTCFPPAALWSNLSCSHFHKKGHHKDNKIYFKQETCASQATFIYSCGCKKIVYAV